MLTCLVPVLFTFYIQDVLKLNKNNSGAKGLITKIILRCTVSKRQKKEPYPKSYAACYQMSPCLQIQCGFHVWWAR